MPIPKISSGPVTDRLKGKVAFVTGTAGGQGRAVALLFARAGAVVYGADLATSADQNAETQRLARQEGCFFTPTNLDVSDEAAVKVWIDQYVQESGQIDILYNNAGFAHFGAIDQLTHEQWAQTLKYELDVIFLPSRAAWPHMVKAGGGVIINVASVSGMIGTPLLPSLAHATGKAGVLGFTKQLATDGAPYNIRVNSISPGGIWTPVTRGAIQAGNPYLPFFENMAALGRVGEPEDIAYAALFLSSDEALWITGTNLVVDGGYSARGGRREQ